MEETKLNQVLALLEKAGGPLERKFLEHWLTYADPSLPLPTPQYKFARSRQWKLDWAWPPYRISVELQGIGGSGKGRQVICHNCHSRVRAMKKGGVPGRYLSIPYASHGSADNMNRDAEKNNMLILLNWQPLLFTSGMINDSSKTCIKLVERILKIAIDEYNDVLRETQAGENE